MLSPSFTRKFPFELIVNVAPEGKSFSESLILESNNPQYEIKTVHLITNSVHKNCKLSRCCCVSTQIFCCGCCFNIYVWFMSFGQMTNLVLNVCFDFVSQHEKQI